MKRRVKTIALCVVAVAVAITIAVPQQTFAANDVKKPEATNVQYVTDNDGNKTGIKTFTISPYTYYNLSQDDTIKDGDKQTLQLNDAKLLQIAKRQIFPKWGIIAEGIFRDQANQLVTIEGSGMMSSSTTSKNSFDRHFSTGKVSNGYDYDWAVNDLAQALSQETSSQKGKTCWDETRITGITQIGNLDDARTLMGQELRNCSDDNDVSKDDFLGNNHQKSEDTRRLPDLEDDKTSDGFANIVTCVNRAGASADYDYVTFGIAVYDFDITPVAAENLKYIEAADEDFTDDEGSVRGKDILMGLAGDNVSKNGVSFRNDTEEGTTTYIRNNTTQEITQSSGLENSVTEESTISTDETFEWGMEQEIGVELNFGGHGDGNCMFPRATAHFNNTWHELWSTTKSKSETHSATKTKTTNTEVTLPGHTIATVQQSLNNKKTSEKYQQPVILNYKVAIFAMSGDYFNGAAGGIENSRYDKQWMSVLFDGSDDSTTSGCNAMGSLYNRGVVNKDTQGYDGAKGKYKVWCDKSAWSKSNKINWNNISSTLSGDSRSSHRIQLGTGRKASTVQDLATELPLLEKAQLLNSKREAITSEVSQIIPLYSLDSVEMKSGSEEYDLEPLDTLYLDSIDLEGYDKDGAEFYEFSKGWGEWVLLNEGGDIIEDDGPGDDASDIAGVVQSGRIRLVNNTRQKITIEQEGATSSEEHDICWRLKPGDETKIISNVELNRPEGSEKPGYMTDTEKEAVETPSIHIKIKDRENDIVNFEVGGTYKGPWDQAVNLGHVLTADAVDKTGKIRGVSVLWEAKGAAGINVDESGETTFTKRGTYKVRPYCYDLDKKKVVPRDESGNPIWIEIVAQDKAALSSIVIDKPEMDEDDTTLSEGTAALGFDLGSYTKFFDQYGDKWEGTESDPLPEVRYSVSGPNGATIDGENILTITRPGTYTVSAKAYDKDGNDTGITIKSIRITVTEEDRLASITMDEPAMSKSERTLKDQNDCITVENLKGLLTYLDQHDDEWTGKKPNVTFTIAGDPKDAEIKGGNFYAYAPGTYTIKPSASGFKINSIDITIEESTDLVLKVEDPGKQFLYSSDDVVELELERYIDATTGFGSKWKGDIPALNFTMDDAAGAAIEEKTVYDGDDDYEGTDKHYFRGSAAGEYTVHVEPVKASAYTEPLDDMHIKVVKGKKVARIEFKDLGEEEGSDDFTINHYTAHYPEIDLSKYLNYYDGYGELIDPSADHVKIPDCEYTLLNPEDYSKGDYKLKRETFTAYEAQFYMIKATMNVTNYDPSITGDEAKEDTILEAATGFWISDIDWMHDFGEWETTKEPTCTEDGTRVKHCAGGEGCTIHEDGEECDEEIVDVVPATGHTWSKYYKFSQADHTLYTYCEKCGVVNEESVTSCPGVPDNGWEGNPANNVPIPHTVAGCTTPGEYRISASSGEEIVTVPAVGHAWDNKYTVTKAPTCNEAGKEAIRCTRTGCNEVKAERIIPKLAHVPDETQWKYVVEDGQELKETCEDVGLKVTECKNCGEDIYDVVMPTGHDWGESEYTWKYNEEAGTYSVTATRKCSHNSGENCIEKETVNAGKEITKQPTSTDSGETTYTAEFMNPAFSTQTKTEADIEPLDTGTASDEVKAALKERKEAATAELKGYNPDVEYADEQARASAVADGCNAIRLARTLEEVDLALAGAKAQIDQLQTAADAEAEAAAFEEKKASCMDSVNGIDAADYTADEGRIDRISQAKEDALAALDNASTEEELNQALESMLTVLLDVVQEEALEQQSSGEGVDESTVAAVNALADSLAENALAEIAGYKNPDNYRDDDKAQLEEIQTHYSSMIKSDATELKKLVLEAEGDMTTEDIKTVLNELFAAAVENAKSELDKVKTSVQRGLEEAEELCDTKSSITSQLNSYKNMQDYQPAQQEEIRNLLAEAQIAISKASTAEEINSLLKAYQAKLDSVKISAQINAAASAAAKAEADRNGIYSGSMPAVKSSKAKAAKKAITVKWKKLKKKQLKSGTTKIEVWVCTNKAFAKGATIEKFAGKKKASLKVKGLKKGTTYYAKVRAIKYVNGQKIVGKWSAVKKVKAK